MKNFSSKPTNSENESYNLLSYPESTKKSSRSSSLSVKNWPWKRNNLCVRCKRLKALRSKKWQNSHKSTKVKCNRVKGTCARPLKTWKTNWVNPRMSQMNFVASLKDSTNWMPAKDRAWRRTRGKKKDWSCSMTSCSNSCVTRSRKKRELHA